MDPHAIFEYLHWLVKENYDSLKFFGRVKMLNFDNVNQAHEMASYEGHVPKIFGKQSMFVVEDNESHLYMIPSWDLCDTETSSKKRFKIFKRGACAELNKSWDLVLLILC